VTKVKFQNLVQDYQNKLADQTIRPEKQEASPAAGSSAQAKKVD
jgi:hypothetical protein